ncbi:hypothetical protein REPUB_Repub14bG0033500 [Reevesia pubescens]
MVVDETTRFQEFLAWHRQIKDKEVHIALRTTLIEYLWERYSQEIGTAGHASTSTSKGETPANVAGNLGQVTLVASVGGVAPHLGSPPARMFDQVTGTALLETVAPTISPVVPAASNVVHSRMTLLGVLTVTSHVPEDMGPVIDPDGNLATGYVPDQDAMSTILLAGWNVSDAAPRGTLTIELHTKNMLSILGCCNQVRETK